RSGRRTRGTARFSVSLATPLSVSFRRSPLSFRDLQLIQQRVEALVVALPNPAIGLEPAAGVGEGLGLDTPRPALCVAPARDEPGTLEHPQMLGDGRLADRKRFG